MKLTIDLDNLKKLSKKGKDIFMKPEAEKELLAILEAEEQIKEIKEKAKEELEKVALKKNPNFSSIESDNVKVYYRAFGSRYRVDDPNADKLPEDLIKTEKKYKIITKEVDKFYKEHGKLPVGINEVERPKKISFNAKKNEQDKK